MADVVTRGFARHRVAASVALLSLAMSILTGCGNPFSDSEDEAVETVAEDQTKRDVDKFAQEIARVVGVELTRYETNSAPCTGGRGETAKDIYTTMGGGQLFVPEERHVAVIAKLRELWVGRGYSVESERRSPPAPVNELAVQTPDGFDISIRNARPPIALAILISSPCRRSPTPLF